MVCMFRIGSTCIEARSQKSHSSTKDWSRLNSAASYKTGVQARKFLSSFGYLLCLKSVKVRWGENSLGSTPRDGIPLNWRCHGGVWCRNGAGVAVCHGRNIPIHRAPGHCFRFALEAAIVVDPSAAHPHRRPDPPLCLLNDMPRFVSQMALLAPGQMNLMPLRISQCAEVGGFRRVAMNSHMMQRDTGNRLDIAP
jgi:hypothetical protein